MQSAPGISSSSPSDLHRYEALLQMADLIVRPESLPNLFHEMAQRLQKVADFQFLNFSLHNPERNVMELHYWEGELAPGPPTEASVQDSASGWVWQGQVPLLFRDLHQETGFAIVLEPLKAKGFRTYYLMPLSTSERRLGALGVGSHTPNAYSESDERLLFRVAEMVAMAVENRLSRQALEGEKHRLQALVDVSRKMASSLDMQTLLPLISECVTRVVPHDFAGVTLFEGDENAMRAYVLSPGNNPSVVDAGRPVSMDQILSVQALMEQKPRKLIREELSESGTAMANRVLDAGIQTVFCMPLVTSKGVLGTFHVGSKNDHAFTEQDQELLNQVATQVASALNNARAYREIEERKDRLAEEKLYLEDEIRTGLNFEEIVGESASLKRVLAQARTVAPSGSTALILGDTGTGKELIARAIHGMSRQKGASFIKVNCAAIPTGLLGSELFGHAKGAFTGAVSQKIGRMELADKGTLFLDEIGDIPIELQPTLLRVLQDHEFARPGSTETIRVDTRLIAATNRDLARAVAEGKFRSDLFYRLNVFPIRMPPLRERTGDIPLLVRHFVQKLSRRMHKKIDTIPNATMDALVNWHWPGNVRELENFIERSVILTEGSVLRVPFAELRLDSMEDQWVDATLDKAQRGHIIRVLRECGGLVSGAKGAAHKLGLKRTTLQSKMRKLGITRKDYAA